MTASGTACPHCGKPLEADDRWCSSCGRDVVLAQPAAPSSYPQPFQRPQAKSKTKIIAIIMIIVIIVAGVGVYAASAFFPPPIAHQQHSLRIANATYVAPSGGYHDMA